MYRKKLFEMLNFTTHLQVIEIGQVETILQAYRQHLNRLRKESRRII